MICQKTMIPMAHRNYFHMNCKNPSYSTRKANKLRQRLKQRPDHKPEKPEMVLPVTQTSVGKLQLKLPAAVAASFCAKPGMRVWFAARGGCVHVTRRPMGPIPHAGRATSKIRKVNKP